MMLGLLLGVVALHQFRTLGLLLTAILILLCIGVGAVCPPRQLQFCPGRAAWTFWFMLSLMCRIGEATNPGPDEGRSHFVLGTFNPSGLKGKAPYIVSHLAHGDIWAVSETHLCAQSMQAFRSGLHFAESPYRYCVGGHPVPAQNNRMFHSAWRGVALLSKFPTRPLPNQWSQGIYESSRIQVTATLVHDTWLTGATVYGEPESAAYPQQKQNNEQLLQCAISQVCHLSKGPRFIAGDWNVLTQSLPAFDALTDAGFMDLQDIALHRWGRSISPTCKNATRKDFCYISAEMQHLLHSVHVAEDIFPDHAVMWGVFHNMARQLPKQVWLTLKAFPWPKDWHVDPQFWNNTEGTVDQRYAALWSHIEATAHEAVPFTVPKTAMGRAKTIATKPVLEGKFTPPKKARVGDVQPHYLAASFRHAQWLRQTRRLQTYVRFARMGATESDHARDLWGAILRAKGFHTTFAEWWLSCQWRTVNAPMRLPFVPPVHAVAEQIFDTMSLAFRQFEMELQKSSRLYARQRRANNPNMIFRDIKDQSGKGVEVLTRAVQAQIEEVVPADSAIVLTSPVGFDVTKPILCQGKPLSVIHHEDDCIWLEDITSLAKGMHVSQTSHVGSDEELFAAFSEAWKHMWDRHRRVPQDRWSNILSFARHHIPRLHLDWEPMDTMALEQAVARKKSTTTAGLDGVTLFDLKHMNTAALQNFVSLFRHAETTGEWPTQMLAGRVTCIAKTDAPSNALDFRPITVLGLLFRCWGTYNAKKAIRGVEPALPEGLFGSRPGKYAGQVWSHLLWAIELAYSEDMPLSGIVAAIRKAFNYLPRPVVFEACALLGIPFRVLKAWAGALASLPRRFQINGSIGPEILSTCGLPEGCALSCLGMIAVDVLFHAWMRHHFPLCQPLSYVDDWQILVASPDFIRPVFTCLENFVQSMDLFLDDKKTKTWSVSSQGRSLMKEQGFGMITYGRNLGAHVQYTRQHTNKVLMERVASLGPLWNRLRLSACNHIVKVRALLCAAWPRGLHGVEATTLSMTAFQQMRSGAMRGLRMDGSGANAHVQLGLVESPLVDPHCWSILQTFRLHRCCGKREMIESTLADLVAGHTTLPANSVSSTLLTRIQMVGWHVNAQGQLCDLFGDFSLFHASMTELQYRLEFQWLQVVAFEVSHRPCFHGLQGCDPMATRKWVHSLEPSDRALFHKILNGTHITQDGKKHCQEVETDQCPFCECSDSRYHRFWECPHFASLRDHLTTEEKAAIVELPEAHTCCGWAMQPTTLLEWNSYFAQLQIPDAGCFTALRDGVVHIFTDGSCHNQHDQGCRFAGWAVILASPDSVHDYTGAEILDRGPLPGLLQSAVRAEIFAVARALQMVEMHEGEVMLWSDCDAVVKKLRRLLAGHTVAINSTHADLWASIARSLRRRQARTGITKVAAHQDPLAAQTALEEWCFRYNHLADKHAVQACMERSEEFWELYARHCGAMAYVSHYNHLIWQVQLSISQQVVRAAQPVQVLLEPLGADLPLPTTPWMGLPAFTVPPGAVRWYGDKMVRLIMSWLWQSVDGSKPMRWVSHFQLYIDYMCSTGHPGPIHVKQWRDGAEVSNLGLLGFSFRQRTRWFIKLLKETLKHMGVSLAMGYGRPDSQIIQMHTGVLALPWDPHRLILVDKWMLAIAGQTFKRQSRLIDSLPFGHRKAEFPEVFVSTFGL